MAFAGPASAAFYLLDLPPASPKSAEQTSAPIDLLAGRVITFHASASAGRRRLYPAYLSARRNPSPSDRGVAIEFFLSRRQSCAWARISFFQ